MALSGGRQVSHDWWRDVCCDKRHSSFSTFPTRSNAAHSPHIYVVRKEGVRNPLFRQKTVSLTRQAPN